MFAFFNIKKALSWKLCTKDNKQYVTINLNLEIIHEV